MSVCAVVGGQFGSEGKGAVVGHIAKQYGHHVRVGAANAGHTVYTPDGVVGPWEKHVLRQLPCAAYVNPSAKLYIGPGALISKEVLTREIEEANAWRKEYGMSPLYVGVDYRAHVITADQISREKSTGLAERIGSTSARAGEGVGMAQADRVIRSTQCVTVAGVRDWHSAVEQCDVPWELSRVEGILLEGTQGYGLSLTNGDFPYVTSRNTTSAGLCADVGVSPRLLERVVMVLRTFPIRVAGNSGRFAYGSREIAWEDLGIDPETERTTVTKKLRRVATFSFNQAEEAAYVNGATEIALMFADYLDPRLRGQESCTGGMAADARRMIGQLNELAPVTLMGTGPHSMVELGREHAHAL